MENVINKNKEYIVEIIDNGFEGEGIAKINNFAVFIPGVIKGETVRILVVKVLSSYAFGKAIEIINSSKNRNKVDCTTYKRCGGCDLRHIKYEKTLQMKQNTVQALVNKTIKQKIEVEQTVGMKNPVFYRNKAQFPVGINKEGKAVIGVFANRTHEIIPIEKCYIQNEQSEEIANEIENFINENKISVYNEKTRKGIIRHIIVKIAIKTKEIMCIVVINGNKIPKEEQLVKRLTKKFKNIKSIQKNINTKNTNVIMGTKNIKIFGTEYIEDVLGEFRFKISPLSFYQVNPIQAEKLYNASVNFANIKKEDIVFDLYCGIGTISLFMAKYAKKVYGVEIVSQAIEVAEENAKLNNINNVEFISGDTEIILEDLINNKKIIPSIIMVDPPRKGLDNKSIENILKVKPEKLVYISCNPATLVRDLAKLDEFYEIKKIQPFDLFPFTKHVETVTVLGLKENDKILNIKME